MGDVLGPDHWLMARARRGKRARDEADRAKRERQPRRLTLGQILGDEPGGPDAA